MKITHLFRDISVSAYVRSANAKHFAQQRAAANPGLTLIMMGVALTLLPFGAAEAQTLGDMLNNWTETVKSIVAFIMNAAVVVGVLAIAYGIKLVIDKSNDRENVKNGHIVVSFVGGALMCMLWFVVRMMSTTVSQDGSIGENATW